MSAPVAYTQPMTDAGNVDTFFDGTSRPVGIQIFTLGERVAADMEGCLHDVFAIGYREVELIGYAGHAPGDLKRLFAAAGLRCPSVKYPPRTWLPGQLGLDRDLDRIVADAHRLELEYVVAMMFRVPDRLWSDPAGDAQIVALLERASQCMTADDWKRNADALNAAGARLARAGLALAYHNSNLDFAPVGSTCGYDLLLEATDPALVALEMDVGYLVAAGRDPFDYLARHPARFRLMHIKDIAAAAMPNTVRFQCNWTEPGAGIVDWHRLLARARGAGVTHFYYEQEPPFRVSPLHSARASHGFLSKLPALAGPADRREF
ncbi:MAG: sugar phosphate isomerase/epimerase family protein [Gammaproteobacteria bacterium]